MLLKRCYYFDNKKNTNKLVLRRIRLWRQIHASSSAILTSTNFDPFPENIACEHQVQSYICFKLQAHYRIMQYMNSYEVMIISLVMFMKSKHCVWKIVYARWKQIALVIVWHPSVIANYWNKYMKSCNNQMFKTIKVQKMEILYESNRKHITLAFLLCKFLFL